jgi:hypothetical protein
MLFIQASSQVKITRAEMNPRCLFPIVLLAAVVAFFQLVLFSVTWSTMVDHAIGQGRFLRGGVSGGLVFYHGTWCLMWACFITSVLGGMICRPVVRWVAIKICLGAWLLWLSPAFFSYPVRMPIFAGTGALILLAGSGFLMTAIGRHLRIRSGPRVSTEMGNPARRDVLS